MFQDLTIVPSAASAFNNAALVGPAFLWSALLCLPLFVAAFFLARSGLGGFGLGKYLTTQRVSFWTVVMTGIWVVLFGGNYDVLRDGVSLLPYVTAFILFIGSVFIGQKTGDVKLPLWYGSPDVSNRKKWLVNLLIGGIVLAFVGLSDTLNWWGPFLQILAVVMGIVIGRKWWHRENSVLFALMVMVFTVVAMMMQPEYFRFGQLGNMTLVHLLWVLMTGVACSAVCALAFVKPCGRVHQSAFVKIKWLLRVVTILCAVLFVLTEAVPFFVVTMGGAFSLFALSVWHAEKLGAGMMERVFAWAIILFGVLVNMPTVVVLGILYSVAGYQGLGLGDTKFLL